MPNLAKIALESTTRYELNKRPLMKSLSPDGKHLAFSDGLFRPQLDVVDLASGRSAPDFPRRCPDNDDLQWSGAGHRLLYTNRHGVQCVDVSTGETATMHRIPFAHHATFSPDENQLATIATQQHNQGLKGFFRPNYHGQLLLTNAGTGQIERSLDLGEGVIWGRPVYLRDRGEVAAINSEKVIAVANLATGEVRRGKLQTEYGADRLLDAGATLVAAGPRHCYLIDASDLQVRDSFDAHTPSLSVGGHLLASRAPDGRVHVIDASKRETLFTFGGSGPVRVSPSGGTVAHVVWQDDGRDDRLPTQVEIFDRRGQVIGTSQERGHVQPHYNVDGNRLDLLSPCMLPIEVRSVEVPPAAS